METDIIYNEDCLKGLSKVPDKSIDLIVIDPPYNIKKDSWDDIKNYEEWIKKVILELQRVLKDNGSFYMFHSEMEVVADFMNFLKNETNFIFRQFIVWNKRFEGSPRKGFLDGYVVVENLRNYQQMAEYILYYTFQKDDLQLGETGIFDEIRNYMDDERIKLGLQKRKINELLGVSTNGGGMACHYFSKGNKIWTLPTKEAFQRLNEIGFNFDYEKLKKWRDTLFKDWKKYRDENRFIFNNQKSHHSVWNYDIDKKIGHCTPKPLDLIKNIILHSSKECQIVLDCFMGSGTTALACKELNRRYIGFEKDHEYCKIISKRLSQQTLSNLSATPRTLPTAIPTGEFNMGLTASATPSPKCPSDTSPSPNIPGLRPNSFTHSQVRRNS